MLCVLIVVHCFAAVWLLSCIAARCRLTALACSAVSPCCSRLDGDRMRLVDSRVVGPTTEERTESCYTWVAYWSVAVVQRSGGVAVANSFSRYILSRGRLSIAIVCLCALALSSVSSDGRVAMGLSRASTSAWSWPWSQLPYQSYVLCVVKSRAPLFTFRLSISPTSPPKLSAKLLPARLDHNQATRLVPHYHSLITQHASMQLSYTRVD